MFQSIRSLVWIYVIVSFIIPYSGVSQSNQSINSAAALVEFAQPLPKGKEGVLATVMYRPSKKESPFYLRLDSKEKTTGSLLDDYDIKNKKSKFVGWFGIVRDIKLDTSKNGTKLLIEMKYQDGLSDSHIMVVSIYGAGDFQATFEGIDHGIRELSLVKVYGTVIDEIESVPIVKAEFVRVWDWRLFTFMNYGTQKGNTAWGKLNTIDDDHIYDAFPNVQYYEDRLGKRKNP